MTIQPWPGSLVRIRTETGHRYRVVRADDTGWLNARDEVEGTLRVFAPGDWPELDVADPDTFRGTVARLALRLGHPPELVAEGVWFGRRNGVWALVSGQNVRGEGPAASGVSSTMTTFGRECAGVEDRVEALRRAMERA